MAGLSPIVEYGYLLERTPDLDDRMMIAALCQRSAGFRALCLEKSRQDKVWWCCAFGYTFDPRETATVHMAPFLLYDFQEKFFQQLDEAASLGTYAGQPAHDLVVQKSRDMGVTWSYLAWIVHGWLFQDGFHTIIGSRNEDAVDTGHRSEKTLFGKLDIFIEALPGWMLGSYTYKRNRRERKITNPANGNEIVGEATSPNFGRGGRYRAAFYDEAAFWEDGGKTPLKLAWGSASQSTNCRVAVSTINPAHPRNDFYDLTQKLEKYTVKLHWRLHPHKDDEWYARQLERETEETIRYEIDMSFELSSSSLVYSAYLNVEKGAYPYVNNAFWELFCCWDFGIRETSITWIQRHRQTAECRLVDYLQVYDKPLDYVVPFVTGAVPGDWVHQYSAAELRQIAEHHTWSQATHYGDPAGKQRSQSTGKSPFEFLEDFGIFILCNDAANDHFQRKQFTQLGLKRLKVNLPQCAFVDLCFLNCRYPTRREGSQATSDVSKPIHDWAYHLVTTVEFFFACEAQYGSTVDNHLPKNQRTRRGEQGVAARRRRAERERVDPKRYRR